MEKDSAYIEYLHELLNPLGKITSKKMFGGHGIYCNGLMMGLVADEVLYVKVDEESKPFFIAAGCEPFIYEAKSKKVAMSYWTVPDEAMESEEQMLPWAKHAYAAALRKGTKAPGKKKVKKQ
jgi:DNA transformation protein and related proteins